MTAHVPRKIVWTARAGAVIVRLLAATWRLHWVNAEFVRNEKARGQIIYVLWHGQLLPLLWAHRNRIRLPVARCSSDRIPSLCVRSRRATACP